MNKELISEIIAYIEKMEQEMEWEAGAGKDLSVLISEGRMPDIYHKLKDKL
jgi:hypothetical protein